MTIQLREQKSGTVLSIKGMGGEEQFNRHDQAEAEATDQVDDEHGLQKTGRLMNSRIQCNRSRSPPHNNNQGCSNPAQPHNCLIQTQQARQQTPG